MKIAVVIRPEAESDINAAFLWYQQQRQGLGDEFLLRIEAALESIRFNPKLNPPIFNEIRRKLTRRFPYGLFYIEAENHILVLAVIHIKRHQKNWQQRIDT
jgi:plasmid stabilization system protein ParE